MRHRAAPAAVGAAAEKVVGLSERCPLTEQFRHLRLARDRRWKLLYGGKLMDVPRDEWEQHRLRPGEGGPKARQARQKFQAVIDRMMREERHVKKRQL